MAPLLRRSSRLRLHLLPSTMHMTGAVLLLLLIGTAATPRNVAGSQPRPASLDVAGRSARALLQTDAPSPEGPPLPTPADVLTVCSTDVLREATRCKDRKHVWFEEGGAEAEEECCKLMSDFYSNASKLTSRNCWCDADVWARNAELELLTQISLADFFDACRVENYTVGEEAISYYQDGEGPCAGMPAKEEEEEEEEKTAPPKRSFGKWVRKALPDNPWLLFSFIVAIPSVIGFSAVIWVFVFHAVLTVVELPHKRAVRKAL